LNVRKQKGETSPAVGWWGILGEFPTWTVTVETKTELPGRMDAVLFPQAEGETDSPSVERLLSDGLTTAFRITGDGIDDTFVLCEEDAGMVTVGDVAFEGRALLVRRAGDVRALAVDAKTVTVGGEVIDWGQA